MEIGERSTVDVIEGAEQDHAAAERIGALLPRPAQPGAFALLVGPSQERLELPEPLYRALRDAVDILGRGDAIVMGSVHQKLTTTEAADLLGISRQYLTRLIDRGELPHEMVGRHRRVHLGDVLAYRSQRAVERRKALSKMTKLDVELGAYEQIALSVALLDANVVHALPICAAILHLREEDIFAVRWSQAILDEARQSLIDRGKPADKVDRRLRAMQEAFPDAEVTGHERLISGLHLPDPNDRHVLAAAIAGGANQIVTANVRDFPEDVLARYDLEAVSPDTFLLSALYSYPELTVATIQQRAAELTRPRIGVTGLLEALRKSGAPQFADAVAAEILGP